MSPKAPRQMERPLLWLLIGSLCISFAPVFIKLAKVSPDSAGFYRMLFAGVSLFLLLKVRRSRILTQRKALILLILGGISLSVDFMCWHRSIHLVGPGFATLLGNLQVFFTALFSCVLFREKIHCNLIIALFMALTGLLFITGGDLNALSESDRIGILFGFGTAFFYSGYILLIKSAMNYQEVSGISAMFIVSVTCAGFFGLVTPATGASFVIPDLTSFLALLGAGVVCTTIGWSFISSAIKLTSATIASLFLLLQPALAFVWDVLLFSRPTDHSDIVGVLLVLSAIYIGSYRRA